MFCHGSSWFVMVHVMVHDVSLSWFHHGSSWFTVMVSLSWFTVMVRHGSLSWFTVMVCHGSLSWFTVMVHHGSLSAYHQVPSLVTKPVTHGFFVSFRHDQASNSCGSNS